VPRLPLPPPPPRCLQLAQMINEKPQLINEYESGKAIPNPQVRRAATLSQPASQLPQAGADAVAKLPACRRIEAACCSCPVASTARQ
jgi:hypothetical protein